MNAIKVLIVFFIIAIGAWSKAAYSEAKYTCGPCSVENSLQTMFCGLYDFALSKWVNGRRIDCPRNEAIDDIKFGCSRCSYFPEPPGGIQSCGLFNYTRKAWAQRPETRSCRPSSLPGNTPYPLSSSQCTQHIQCNGNEMCVDGRCVAVNPPGPMCSTNSDCYPDVCVNGSCVRP